MIVFPAIDLKDGQVVRLAEGDMARATVYGDDPAAQALAFAEAGAQHLHVVDLDGAFAGESRNRAAVEAIVAAFPGHVQLGGGIRTPEAVAGWFDLGVSRIVMGTAALTDPEFVARWRANARAVSWSRSTPGTAWSRRGLGRSLRRAGRGPRAPVRGRGRGVAAVHRHRARRHAQGLQHRGDRRPGAPHRPAGDRLGRRQRPRRYPYAVTLHASEGIEGVITGRALYDGRLDLAAALQMAART